MCPLRAHCFRELVFRGERGLFVCPVKETANGLGPCPFPFPFTLGRCS